MLNYFLWAPGRPLLWAQPGGVPIDQEPQTVGQCLPSLMVNVLFFISFPIRTRGFAEGTGDKGAGGMGGVYQW